MFLCVSLIAHLTDILGTDPDIIPTSIKSNHYNSVPTLGLSIQFWVI